MQPAGSSKTPLPSLDRIGGQHIACVRSLLAKFDVTPACEREDLLQEVLFQAHLSRDSRLDPRALLSGITHHVVIRWTTKCNHRAVAIARYADMHREQHVQQGAEEENYAAAERIEIVHQSISELAPIFRDVLERSDLDGTPMSEIAKDAGIPANTGYTRLHIARGRFVEALRRQMARRRIGKDDLRVRECP